MSNGYDSLSPNVSQVIAATSNSNLTAVELSLISVDSELNYKNNETNFEGNKNKKKYVVLFSCLVIQLCVRWIGVFGNYLPYLASVMTSKNIDLSNQSNDDHYIEERYNYYTDKIVWTYSIATVMLNLTMCIGGQIEYKFGPKLVVLIGSLLIISGLCLTYVVLEYSNNPYLLYCSYGTLGAGSGILYTTPYLIGMRWFEDENKKGIVSGLILSGLSLSLMSLTALSTQFVNPNNIPIDSKIGFIKQPSVLKNVSTSFLKFAVICFSLFLFGIIFIQNPPPYTTHVSKETIYSDYGVSLKHKKTTVLSTNSLENKSLIKGEIKKRDFQSVKSIVCCATFWNLFFTLFFLPWTYIGSQWKEFNNKFLGIENDQMLSIMASSSAICQFIAYIFSGYLFDKLQLKNRNGYKILMSIIALCLILFIGSWTQLKLIKNDTLLIVCAWIWVTVLYVLLSGPHVLLPTQTAHIYGTQKGGIVYGLLSCARIGSTLYSMAAITQTRKALGWFYMNLFWLGTQCILFILILVSK
eukprot:514120_1